MNDFLAIVIITIIFFLSSYGLKRFIEDQVILFRTRMEKKRLELAKKEAPEVAESFLKALTTAARKMEENIRKHPFPPGGFVIQNGEPSAYVSGGPVGRESVKPPQPCFNGLCGCNEADICLRGLSPDSCEFNGKSNKNENSY